MIRNIRTKNLIKFRSSHYYALLKEQERGGEKSFLKKDIARLQKEARSTNKRGGSPSETLFGEVTFEIRVRSHTNYTGDVPNWRIDDMTDFLFEYIDDQGNMYSDPDSIPDDVAAAPRMHLMIGTVFETMINTNRFQFYAEKVQLKPISDNIGEMMLAIVPCKIITKDGETVHTNFDEHVRSELNAFNSRVPTPDTFGVGPSAADNIPYLKLYIPAHTMRWSDTRTPNKAEFVFPHDPVGSVPPTLFDPAPIIVDTHDGGSSKTRRRTVRK